MLVLVPGAGRWCCELAVHVVETGCWCRCRVPVLVLGAGRRCCELAVHVYLHSSSSALAHSCVKGCTVCVHTFERIVYYAQRQAPNRPLTIVSACFSVLHTIVVLDTAWPWASEAYGLCRLCAYFCAHRLIRARSYGLIVLQIVASIMLHSQ